MRFIELTSRKFIFEDATRNRGALNYKCRWFQTQRRFKFFYILNLSIGKPYYKGGTMLKLICATKCSNNHMHPQIHSQDSLHFTIILIVLRGASSDSLDPLGASSDLPDPLGVGSGSPNPFGRGIRLARP